MDIDANLTKLAGNILRGTIVVNVSATRHHLIRKSDINLPTNILN